MAWSLQNWTGKLDAFQDQNIMKNHVKFYNLPGEIGPNWKLVRPIEWRCNDLRHAGLIDYFAKFSFAKAALVKNYIQAILMASQ